MDTPTAVLTGTRYRPELHLYFHSFTPHAASPKRTLREFAEWLPMSFWNARGGYWRVIATGSHPERLLSKAGFTLDLESGTAGTDLAGITDLDELAIPLTKLSNDGRSALVLPRLAGAEVTKERLGVAASWDRKHKRYTIPVADCLLSATRTMRPGILWDPRIEGAARAALSVVTTDQTVADAAAAAGAAKDLSELSRQDVEDLKRIVGDVPDWFGLNLYPFQEAGAIAVAAGHSLLADEPGLGKAQPLCEPVLTPRGFRTMGSLRCGDSVIGSDARPYLVTGVFDRGVMDVVRVTLADGSWTRCSWDHLWQVGTGQVLSTRQLVDEGLLDTQGLSRFTVPRMVFGVARQTAIISVVDDGREQVRCIKVSSPDSLYVTRDGIITHNTRQTLAASAIVGSKRTVITCLPVGLTGWKYETLESGLHTLGGQHDGEVVVIRSGRKPPETLPESGVVITSDSLLTSRPQLLQQLIDWRPEVYAYDEAHRGKSFESARSKATRKLAAATTKRAIAMTGTPIFASPHELAPILEFTGHLAPTFGGLDAFLNRYCKEGYFGGWEPVLANLDELRMKLARSVWVRRRKRDVLPDLPSSSKVARFVDVKMADYNRAYRDVRRVIKAWLAEFAKEAGHPPNSDDIRQWASGQIGLVSMLRRSAGLAKVPAAVEIISDHVASTSRMVDGERVYDRPLVVWTHHREVTDAMSAAVPESVGRTGVIAGGVGHAERDELVSEFQAGRIPVLVCSIAAAGVAITLTRSQDTMFVETDWTPAALRQALDRLERIGQKNHITATTLLAEDTLDLRIQQVLRDKSKVLDRVYGEGNDLSVAADLDGDAVTASKILMSLVHQELEPQHRGSHGG